MPKSVKDAIERGRTTVEDVIQVGRNTVEDVIQVGRNTVGDVINVGRNTVEDVLQVGRKTVDDVLEVGRKTMNAAVLHGREDVRIEQVPVPEAGPGELVLSVGAALTCGTDLKIAQRGHPKIPFPLTRGHALAPDRQNSVVIMTMTAESGRIPTQTTTANSKYNNAIEYSQLRDLSP